MPLSESEIRARMVALLDGCDTLSMNRFLMGGVMSRAFSEHVASRIMQEELAGRSHEVQQFWLGECNCHGTFN